MRWKWLPLTKREAPRKPRVVAVPPQPEAPIKPSTAAGAGAVQLEPDVGDAAPDTCFKDNCVLPPALSPFHILVIFFPR